jgi:hypothetical protein
MLALGILQTSSIAAPKRQTPKPKPATFAGDIRPAIAKYCEPCHSGKNPPAGLDLSALKTADSLVRSQDTWQRVVARMSRKEMPPPGSPAPSDALRARVCNAVQDALNAQCKLAGPGSVTIRRLNREEYDNTIRDLIGLDLRPSEDFPSDDVGYGFDNIGDVLSMSPLLMEKYLNAAERVARAAVIVPGVRTRHFDASEFSEGSRASQTDDGGRLFYSECTITKAFSLPAGGRYRLRTLAGGDLAGTELPKMLVTIDGKPLTTFEVGARRPNTAIYEAPVSIDSGKHTLGVAFTNDYYNAKDPPGRQDRNLFLKYIELTGPLDTVVPLTRTHLGIIPSEPAKDAVPVEARADLKRFANRAFRRPVRAEELDRLVQVFDSAYKATGNFDAAMQVGVEAVLVSPEFLFRVELAPGGAKGKVRALDDYELASRLSYFLWSSMPDGQLFELANEGKLHRPEVLRAQVVRMIRDPKCKALADNFAGQWLQLRKLAIVQPDPQRFPGVDDSLKADMATETKMFFNAVLQDDLPITNFIDSNFTFVNERLAKHYGIPGVGGSDFQRIDVQEPRGGVLSQASVLLVTSNPTRTSPTKRGKWVLEQILGTPPPPPPPGVGVITDEQHRITASSLRQLMEEHRKNPMCAACHAKMDPIGFGLENFDAVGRWRTKDGGFDLDTTGKLPDGRTFKGPGDLKKILLADKSQFARALSEKLLTYALGRGIESSDKCAIDAIVKRSAATGYRFDELIEAVVESDAFLEKGE